MPENQAPETQASENQAPDTPARPLASPPGLTLLRGDAAGACIGGHCVLPATATEVASAPAASQTSGSDAD